MKYKILKDCKYSPNGYDEKSLTAGQVVDLPDAFGVPFTKQGLCEEAKAEEKKEDAPAEDKPKAKKSRSKQA